MSLQWFLEYEYLQHALAAGVLVAIFGGVLGVFLVLRQMSMLGDGLAHVSFGGVAVGLAAHVSSSGQLMFGLVAAVAGAILIQILRERQIVKGDTAIGILFTAGLAVGILVVSATGGLTANSDYLFGQILSISQEELLAVGLVGAILALVLSLFYKEFFAMTFSEEAARVTGLPVKALNTLFMAITAATIVVCAQVVGVLLVSALVIVPAATALQFARSFRGTIALSIAVGVLSVVGGLVVSSEFGLATGASIAACSIGMFLLSLSASRLRQRAKQPS